MNRNGRRWWRVYLLGRLLGYVLGRDEADAGRAAQYKWPGIQISKVVLLSRR